MTAVATRPALAAAMKWWGWGDEGVAFTHEDKPALRPFFEQHLGRRPRARRRAPDRVRELDVTEPHIDGALRAALEGAVGEG